MRTFLSDRRERAGTAGDPADSSGVMQATAAVSIATPTVLHDVRVNGPQRLKSSVAFINNCYGNYGATNAREMLAMLG